MIPIEELRIGNKVLFAESGLECDIIEIDRKGLTVDIPESGEESLWIELDNFEPIPINKDHLIDLGFEKTNHDKPKDTYLHREFFIEVLLSNVNKSDNMVFNRGEILKLDMKLHQLQNLINILK